MGLCVCAFSVGAIRRMKRVRECALECDSEPGRIPVLFWDTSHKQWCLRKNSNGLASSLFIFVQKTEALTRKFGYYFPNYRSCFVLLSSI